MGAELDRYLRERASRIQANAVDPMNVTNVVRPVREDYRIPSEAEHKRLIQTLWIACVAAGGAVFLVFGGIVLSLFLKGYDSKRIVEISTSVFQVLSMTAGVGFFIPLGLTSIVTLLLGIRMNRKSVSVLDKLDDAIESRLARVDGLVSKTEAAYKKLETGEIPDPLRERLDEAKKFIVDQMEKLRSDIRGARTAATDELAAALEEGERAVQADAERAGPPCHSCGEAMLVMTYQGVPTGQFMCATCVPGVEHD